MARGTARSKSALWRGPPQARAIVVEPVSRATWLVVDGEVVPFTRLSAEVPPQPASPSSLHHPHPPPLTTTHLARTLASPTAALQAAYFCTWRAVQCFLRCIETCVCTIVSGRLQPAVVGRHRLLQFPRFSFRAFWCRRRFTLGSVPCWWRRQLTSLRKGK